MKKNAKKLIDSVRTGRFNRSVYASVKSPFENHIVLNEIFSCDADGASCRYFGPRKAKRMGPAIPAGYGLKCYYSPTECILSMNFQKNANKNGIAPDCSTNLFLVTVLPPEQHERRSTETYYAYATEHAKPISKPNRQKFRSILKSGEFKLKMHKSSLSNIDLGLYDDRNFGWIKGKLVVLDFGDESIRMQPTEIN